MKDKVFIDTNVCVYSIGNDINKKEVTVQVGVTTEINFNLKKKIYKLETLTITPKE